jgi:hypothetical protein
VILLEFWLGLTVRYRLSRRQRIERPSLGLVRDLLFGGSFRFDHLAFTFSPRSTRRRMVFNSQSSLSLSICYRVRLILIGSPITLGSAFTYQSLFFFRAGVRSGPSFLGDSPIRTRPATIMPIVESPLGCRESYWIGPDYRWLYASDRASQRCEGDPILGKQFRAGGGTVHT